MIEIKKVNYDDLKCCGNEDEAICPYCGEANYIEPDDYKGQDEEAFEECVNCGKTFVHQINYKISFTSEPYENWGLREIKWRSERLKEYKDSNEKFSQNAVEYFSKNVEELIYEASKILEENKNMT